MERSEGLNITRVLCFALVTGFSSIQAATCPGVSDINEHTEHVYDINGDGFPDIRISLNHTQQSNQLPEFPECMIEGGRSVVIAPLGGAKLVFQSTFNGPSPVALTPGSHLGPGTPADWANFPSTLYLSKISGPLSIPFETVSGPLNPSLGSNAYFGVRIPAPSGHFYGWIQIAAGSAGTVLSMASQPEPDVAIQIGTVPPPPNGTNGSIYTSVDVTGDNSPDLFIVRTTRTDANTGDVTTSVSVKDLESGDLLCGPGSLNWPTGDYADSLVPRQLIQEVPSAGLQWKPLQTAAPLWVETRAKSGSIQTWGPLAEAAGGFIGVRRADGSLCTLSFDNVGRFLTVDWTRVGLLAAGTRNFFQKPEHVTARSHFDIDRDGLVDFVAIRLSFLDETPGHSTSVQDRLTLHALGSNTLGKEFLPGPQLTLPVDPSDPSTTTQEVSLRNAGIRYMDLPLGPFDETAPSDRYLPFHLKTAMGFKLGWIKVDAHGEQTAWDMGIATAEGDPVTAGEQRLGSTVSITFLRHFSLPTTTVRWSEFINPMKLLFSNKVGDKFQVLNLGAVIENKSVDNGNGWVDRSVTLSGNPPTRFYRVTP